MIGTQIGQNVKLFSFCKLFGLKQLIEDITRPNKKGGSTINLILTNSYYIKDSGVLDDMISDHYTIFSIRKKKRESKIMKWIYVRDYKNFNSEDFIILFKNKGWDLFMASFDPDFQWAEIMKNTKEILAVMCPYKKIYARSDRPLWIMPEIHIAIRERKLLCKKF